jgi:hypothetical protein
MDPDQTADAQAGLDPCWSQTHYVGFVTVQLNYYVKYTVFQIFLHP